MTDRVISVVIPTFNRVQYLLEAIDSVLAQGYASMELIVLDDGSTDETADVVARRGGGIRYHYQPNRGIAGARNAGAALAKGAYLAFLDSDDVWMPGKLARQMAVLDENPLVDVVYGHAEQFYSPDVEPEFWRRYRARPGVIPAPVPGAMLMRRAAYDRVGPFDPRFGIGVEMDWYARVREAGVAAVMLPDVVFRRRLHRSNFNILRADEQSERLHVLKSVLDRRRQRAVAS